MNLRTARVLVALATIAVTLGLVVMDAFATGQQLLTPTRLQALFAFIGLLLGVEGVMRGAKNMSISIQLGGKSDDDDSDN